MRDRSGISSSLWCLYFSTSCPPERTQRGSIRLDDLTVKGPTFPAGGTVIEDFEEPRNWLVLASEAEEPDTIEYLPEAARTGTGGLRYSWRTPLSGASRGIFLPAGIYPLPAIGSGVFQTGQVVRFIAGKQEVSVSIRDVTEYFPTINPSLRPFLLVAEEDYRQHVERVFDGKTGPGWRNVGVSGTGCGPAAGHIINH